MYFPRSFTTNLYFWHYHCKEHKYILSKRTKNSCSFYRVLKRRFYICTRFFKSLTRTTNPQNSLTFLKRCQFMADYHRRHRNEARRTDKEGGFSPQTLSCPRDIRRLVSLAVQISHHVLSFGSERRPYQTKAHHVYSQTERLSWKRAFSWPTHDQQKPQLWLWEICFARGHR